jgi:hypothetical protein
MKLIGEKISDVILKENALSPENSRVKELCELLTEMRKAGLIKQPQYDLPLVDTIGRRYYGRINRHIS